MSNRTCDDNSCDRSRSPRKLSFAEDDYDSDDDEGFYTANETQMDPYLSFADSCGPADTSSCYDMSSGYFNRSDMNDTSFRTANPGTPTRFTPGNNYPSGPSPHMHSTPRHQRQQDPDYYGTPAPSPINRTIPECCRTGQGQDSSFYPVSHPEDSSFFNVSRQGGYDMSAASDMSSGYFDRSQPARRIQNTSPYPYSFMNDTRGQGRNDPYMNESRGRGRNDTTPYTFIDMPRSDPAQQSLYSPGRNPYSPQLNQNNTLPYNPQQDYSIRSVQNSGPGCQLNISRAPGPPLPPAVNMSRFDPGFGSPCSAKNNSIPPPPNNTPRISLNQEAGYQGSSGPQMNQGQLPRGCPNVPCSQNTDESFEVVDQPQDESFVQIESGNAAEPFVLVPDCLTGPRSNKQPTPRVNKDKSTDKLSQRSKTSQKSDGKKSKIPQKKTSGSKSGKPPGEKDSKTKQEEDKKMEQAKQDSINMLSVVISTVMLLAAEVPNIPANYSSWTVKYLKCIKNLQGQYPANVKKFLTMLTSEEEMNSILKAEKKCKCPYTPNDKTMKTVVNFQQ